MTTPRGSDYLLQYDESGALQSLTTPRGHIHAFSIQTSLGFYKYQYHSPVSPHPYELRYDDNANILAKIYPHQSGRVSYLYDQHGNIEIILAGMLFHRFRADVGHNSVVTVLTIRCPFLLKGYCLYTTLINRTRIW